MLEFVGLDFFCNEPAATAIYAYRHTLSLHAALPSWRAQQIAATVQPQHRRQIRRGLRRLVDDDTRLAAVAARNPDFAARQIIRFAAIDRKSTSLNSSH